MPRYLQRVYCINDQFNLVVLSKRHVVLSKTPYGIYGGKSVNQIRSRHISLISTNSLRRVVRSYSLPLKKHLIVAVELFWGKISGKERSRIHET